MSWVDSPGLVLCGVEGELVTAENPEGCYAKIPAAIYVDMEMFKIDNPEDCACGVALDVKDDAPRLVAATSDVFNLHSSDVQQVSFIVWDIENGVKLRDINKFSLDKSLNTADYLATLLTNSAQAVRHLTGFYGHVNDFNPADWIVNITREVTMICFSTVITYKEESGNKHACNEGGVEGDILAVPPCNANFLLDVDYEWTTYPERKFQPLDTPRFNYEVAAGSSNTNGNGPGGSHPVDWYNFDFSGATVCSVSTDCSPNFFCDLSTNRCQQCIRDSHCDRFSEEGDPTPPKCVTNNGHRMCEFDRDNDLADPTPGVILPEGLVNCNPRCHGQYCKSGECVDCRDFNDCGLLFSPASTYSKVCNQTAQCNYVYLPPQAAKNENATTVIAIASAVGFLALVAIIVGVVFFVKRYRASNAAYQNKLDETANADSMLGSSPLYEGQTKMVSNPLAGNVELE
ncbi:uncharacterized protein AMSG_03136 [Thecamonas trahens ATCC 50062]|uniref:Uncharacterized protein n=1 Tax=Thecamonas trahens ATCC 50062 TaxID=461836 RepID=A0A0L0D315_THETB|nr:hypothetical protein AMSG_03136 [Thecamonas trahens ATCC 50062]KNC46699.1 hypothetical protein AMSG_03136 [Thecamonas trahens ATCC 50062]|eukprot:XP_013760465.1 hypothetical protein AMSG_03136 [Thecamonas trahens ATCC 50062]